jgi:hypothetical protein
MKKLILVSGIALLLQACTWVELTPSGEKARVLSQAEVSSCKKLGQTTVSVKSEVGGVARSSHKIQQELNALARNSAGDIGGDTVVPASEPKDGRQVFDVYRCVNP